MLKSKPVTRMTHEQQGLAESCMKLAYKLAIRHMPNHFRQCPQYQQDSIDVAIDALIRAAIAFRPELGYQFTTLAGVAICRSVWSFWEKKGRHVRQSVGMQIEPFESGFGPSLSKAFSNYFDTLTKPEFEEDNRLEQVKKAVAALRHEDPRAYQILELMYFQPCGYLKLHQVGKKLNISPERVRQLQARGINKLRVLMGLLTKEKSPRKGSVKLTGDERKQVIELRNAGVTVREVADKFNITATTIFQITSRARKAAACPTA